MLTTIGILLLAFGGWLGGAIFMATPNVPFLPKEQPYRARAICAYLTSLVFAGIGAILILGL